MKFVVSTSHGSFYVKAESVEAAKAFALAKLQSRFPGEVVSVEQVWKA